VGGRGHTFLQRWGRKLRLLPANKIGFGDVQAHAQKAPYTFYRPSRQLLDNIVPGDLVKVWFLYEPGWWNIYSGERMWVEVTARSGDVFVGKLDNIPADITGMGLGHIVEFRAENILSAQRDDPEGDQTQPYWKFCTTSQAILDGEPVDFLARSEPLKPREGSRRQDSGWSFLAAGESGSEVFKAGLARSVPLGKVLNVDDRWLHLINEPVGSKFEWSPEEAKFVRLRSAE